MNFYPACMQPQQGAGSSLSTLFDAFPTKSENQGAQRHNIIKISKIHVSIWSRDAADINNEERASPNYRRLLLGRGEKHTALRPPVALNGRQADYKLPYSNTGAPRIKIFFVPDAYTRLSFFPRRRVCLL